MVVSFFANWSLKVLSRKSNCCCMVGSSWYFGGVKESGLMVSGNICCVVALFMGICVKSSIGGSRCPIFIPFGKFTWWFELLMARTCNVVLCKMSCTPSINFTSVSVSWSDEASCRGFDVMSLNGNWDRSVVFWWYTYCLCYRYLINSWLHVFCITEKMSFISDVTLFIFISIIRYSVFPLEVYT